MAQHPRVTIQSPDPSSSLLTPPRASRAALNNSPLTISRSFSGHKPGTPTNPINSAPMEHNNEVSVYVEPSDVGTVHIFCGNANRELAAEVASKLSMQCGRATVKQFADGETNVVIHDSVRGNDIFVIQSICAPANDSLMELILMISALRRASAKSITAVIPYFGYSRQSKMRGTVFKTIGAADVALLLETVGVDRVISLDLHEGQIEGFFSPKVPVDNLEPYLAAVPYFLRKNLRDIVFIAPSAQGVGRTKKFFDVFVTQTGVEARMAMVVSKTTKDSETEEAMNKRQKSARDGFQFGENLTVIGEIKPYSDIIIVDDIIDTGSRALQVSYACQRHGCGRLFMFATHGLFSGDALAALNDSPLCEIVVTNTIPVKDFHPKVRHLSIGGILAECIRRIHSRESVDSLYSIPKARHM